MSWLLPRLMSSVAGLRCCVCCCTHGRLCFRAQTDRADGLRVFVRAIPRQLVFNVDSDRRVAIQYGDGPGELVYLDDPSESTVSAIKLGYA